jgi:Leucine-rich repeat (LRR) protein
MRAFTHTKTIHIIFVLAVLLGFLICGPRGASASASAVPKTGSPLFWLLPLLIGVAAVLCISISFLTKKLWQRILLWIVALLLSIGAALMLINPSAQQAEAGASVTPASISVEATPAISGDVSTDVPTASPVYTLTFTTETLPEPSALSVYPELKQLDISACEQVTASLFETIRQAVPANCQILWCVPLTDGRFPADSTSLTLPHFSAEDAALLPYFEELTALDASGSIAYDALLDLGASQPDLALTFTLPVGDKVLTMDDEALTPTEAPDFALLTKGLAAFPKLLSLDLSEAAVDPADAVSLSDRYPDVTVRYSVPVANLRFPMDAASIALEGSDLSSVEELLAALPYLPALEQVDLHGTALTMNDALAVLDTRPELILSQTVELGGESVELDAEELDLRNGTYTAEELTSLLRPFAALKKVHLPQTAEAAVEQLEAAYPQVIFPHKVTVFGKTIENDTEELDISKTRLKSPDAVLSEIAQLPNLKKLVMCDCGLKNEQMEQLMAARPEVKFVWTIHLNQHAIRTDATRFSTLNPPRFTRPAFSDSFNEHIRRTKRLYQGDIKALKYCTDLIALDLGHNYLTTEDLDVLQYMPHLKILILADNKIKDISPLANLKELEYVELFTNLFTDVSPLVGLENLTDINISNNRIKDVTLLQQFTHAKRLWFTKNSMTTDQKQAIVDALPDCVCNFTNLSPTEGGWREGERYTWLRSILYD